MNEVTGLFLPEDSTALDIAEASSSIKGYDYLEFVDDVFDTLNHYQSLTGELKDFSMKPNYSYEDVGRNETNSIRWHIVKRTYAGNTNTPHEGRLMPQKMEIDVKKDLNNPGYQARVFARHYDTTIDFVSWSKNYRDANRGGDFLETFFEDNANLFMPRGLHALRYLGRMSDQYLEPAGVALYGVPIRIYVRTIKVSVVYTKTLEQLQFNLINK